MFLAVLQWKRIRTQSNLPLENFFESLTTAIRYVRYTPGIRTLLTRHAIFLFFISVIPSLMTEDRFPEDRSDPNDFRSGGMGEKGCFEPVYGVDPIGAVRWAENRSSGNPRVLVQL